MRKLFAIVATGLYALCACTGCVSYVSCSHKTLCNEIRPPAAPLVLIDPATSIWSMGDESAESVTKHTAGSENPLLSVIRVDSECYRILGDDQIEYSPVIPTIKDTLWEASYVMDREPSGDWTSPLYDDSGWERGPGAIGSLDNESVRTRWSGPGRDVWVRRSAYLNEDLTEKSIMLDYSHDDVFELYVNGVEVANTGNTWENDIRVELPQKAKATLGQGKVTMAAHCHNTIGGAYVDFGLYSCSKTSVFPKKAAQKSVNVLPLRTIYTFECGGVEVEMTFTSTFLLDDLDLMSRPVNYLAWKVRSTDGKSHHVQLYFETTPDICVGDHPVPVALYEGSTDGLEYVKVGATKQNAIIPKGYRKRIDRGYYYIATGRGKGEVGIVNKLESKEAFLEKGILTAGPDSLKSDNYVEDRIGMAYCRNLGEVGEDAVEDELLIAYDDVYSIQYFHEYLKGYWARDGRSTIEAEMDAAARDYDKISDMARAFDERLMREATRSGGRKYAELCALAYRQCIASHKLVQSPNGDLLWLAGEDIGAVDISYPASPLFLLYNPELCKGMMNGIFHYSESGLWRKPFAAHDLGHYPCANGQHYGGNMPVEECGNMLILCAALAKVEKNASYAQKHWACLTSWAEYLSEHGLDPADQLCTDAFTGHIAHNANLSIKAIEGIASYGMLAGMLGKKEESENYMSKAREMAKEWKVMASAGDHYRLAFDRPGSWSQKYNLVWDRLLGLDVFDQDIVATEISYYLTRMNKYGLPLDSRQGYTKSDWVMWTATMAPDMETFRKLTDPLWDFYNETSDRVPMSDWIHTGDDKRAGFEGRSVVGAYFMNMLSDELGTRKQN